MLDNATTDDKPVIDSVLGGLAAFDYDNDGRVDLYFTNGARLPDFDKSASRFWNRLYRNLGDGRFEDVTERAGVKGNGYSFGAAAADYDNDGWVDLYVSGYDHNVLYRNLGNGLFEDRTEAAKATGRYASDSSSGSGTKPWSVAALWFDYDRNGHLDLLVVNYLDWNQQNNRVCGESGRRLSCAPDMYDATSNILYRNGGDGTFEDVSRETGIAALAGKGMSAVSGDIDQDGFADIFIANDGMRDYLLRSVQGQRFEEVAVEFGAAFNEDGVPVSSMGVGLEDINNDGFQDIFVTALTNETFPLLLNQEGRGFRDVTYSSGLGLLTTTLSGWGTAIADFDNDGWKDLFTANSHVSENVESYRGISYAQPNVVFRNSGEGTFEGPVEISPAAAHRGSAAADLNNDGRLDLVVSVIGAEVDVLLNRSPADAHWVLLDLVGRQSNRDGIGAVVRVETDAGPPQYRTVGSASGYASSSDTRVHFGLGAATRLERIEVRWPSGAVQTIENAEIDQVVRIVEPESDPERR